MSTSNWNTIIDPYYDDEEDEDPYNSNYNSYSSDSLEESIKFAKLSKNGDKLILINNQNMIKLFERKEITFGEKTPTNREIGNFKKIVNWLLIREFKVSNIVNDIKGLDLIETFNIDGKIDINEIVLLDSKNKLFYFNPSVTKTNSTSNNFRKSSFFLERPLLVTCMTIIVLSFSYVEYLQVD
ncbi:hypothetical protein CONCODRAFT_86590 [Conidiobolus coronatus NRRL 28638]|uniref:Uncharacterized protein n=1 Tax=Conidiobolus coronatus (strain ATCC 28846 / CBS 209.66 / NRRL 28638) TaxID=796925 RepID=A0A137NZW8_CONC2|nr:hypothetical protein CONCODRAFT_86590 [Conidiobolus coronatus NRRL 28638]|eukprot:KXN68211.1 hypothetical protein CONCODRAFT_86590 [Conidiobolus coronatus NRRL 28638]